MIELTKAEWKVYEAFKAWLDKEQPRVNREWAKEWDGTEAHGIVINDRQCDRIQAARDRLGITDEVIGRFRAMERECWRQECAA